MKGPPPSDGEPAPLAGPPVGHGVGGNGSEGNGPDSKGSDSKGPDSKRSDGNGSVADGSNGEGSNGDGSTEPEAEAPGPGPDGGARRRSGAIDPRLLRYTRATRRFLGLAVGLGAVTALLVVAQAWLIADVTAGAFIHHRDEASLRGPLLALLAVAVGRAAVGWATERSAARTSARAKSDLRVALVERMADRGPAGAPGPGTGALAVLATRGIDALDGYFARYLPQVFLAVIVPVTVICVIAGVDWLSAVIIALTVPLIPVFMALVGSSTARRTARQVGTLQRLAGHFLDVVAGLPTLKVFGRARAQAETIRRITDRYRTAAMDTLKVAFLSSLILELLATVSVALVAVAVGLRLLGGHLDFRTALFVLVLAPEAYLPLRQLGAHYHDSAEGMAAAESVFAVLDAPAPARGTRTDVGDPSVTAVRLDEVAVTYPGRARPALGPLSLTVEPGRVLVVTGPSGAGKSTLLLVLAGLLAPTAGRVEVGRLDLADVDPDAWRAQLALVPQHPHLFATTVAENVRLGRPGATDRELARAVSDAGLDEVVAGLPHGLETRLGEGGHGLSHGERQRVALARAFLRDAPMVLLDEPTSGLDGATEAAVQAAVARLVAGRTVVMVAHRPSLLSLADRVLAIGAPTEEPAADETRPVAERGGR